MKKQIPKDKEERVGQQQELEEHEPAQEIEKNNKNMPDATVTATYDSAHGSAAVNRTTIGSPNIPWIVIVVDDVGVVGTRTRHADRRSDRAGGGLARHRRHGPGRPEE